MGSRKKSKLTRVYTIGEVNKLIDAILHPLAKENPSIMILDGILHAINERNPSESILKFMKYTSPKLFEQITLDINQRRPHERRQRRK